MNSARPEKKIKLLIPGLHKQYKTKTIKILGSVKLLCFNVRLSYQCSLKCNNTVVLTLKRLGGGGAMMAPLLDISRDNSATREALAATLYDNFLSSFQTAGGTVPKLRNIVYMYMHVGQKMAPKCDFVYKNQCKLIFFHLVHINMLIFKFTLNCWN